MVNWKKWIGRRFGLLDTEPWAYATGAHNSAGKTVTESTALCLSAVWGCIRVNSEAVGSLPITLHQKDGNGGRTVASDHPIQFLLQNPNADMTGTEFWSAMAAWILARGNAFAMIERFGDRIVSLELLPADTVSVTRDSNYELVYSFTLANQSYRLPSSEVLHIRGFGFGGDVGLSPIVFGAQSIGSAIAADETAAKVFANGLMPSGVFSVPPEVEDLTEEQRKQLKTLLADYMGSQNAGKTMLLEGGMKFEKISLDPEVMQMLETRRFNVEEVCRLYGTPPVVIGHAGEGVTAWGSGIESLILQWLTTGLNPILTRIEKRVAKQLLSPADRMKFYAEFNREGIMQADSAAKAAFLSSMTMNGLMTRNEGRARLNLPTMEGGDVLTAQTALAPLDKLGIITGGGNVQD